MLVFLLLSLLLKLHPCVVVGADDEVAESEEDGPPLGDDELLRQDHEDGAGHDGRGRNLDEARLQGGGDDGGDKAEGVVHSGEKARGLVVLEPVSDFRQVVDEAHPRDEAGAEHRCDDACGEQDLQ